VKNMEEAVKSILQSIGEDPDRQGLLNTPSRVAKMYEFVTSGYHQNAKEILNNACFDVDYDEMVVVANIEYYSLCEHHMLPFFGVVHVGYIPNKKVVGLSKIPRIVEMFARRLQVQENMTKEIAETIAEIINPKGVGVVVEGQHMCMMMRGVQKDRAKMVTSTLLGEFRDDQKTRDEFLQLIRSSRVSNT
jgi:GTP cyclohydrolase IA